MRLIAAYIIGLVFGTGIALSGMANPAKVLNFFDIAGSWDPSLIFVMGGALVTTFIGYRLVWRRTTPTLGTRFDIPTGTRIDRSLILGSALFGIGWGIGGFCPGPAWTALAMGAPGTLIFLPAMLIGIVLGGRAKSFTIFTAKGA